MGTRRTGCLRGGVVGVAVSQGIALGPISDARWAARAPSLEEWGWGGGPFVLGLLQPSFGSEGL